MNIKSRFLYVRKHRQALILAPLLADWSEHRNFKSALKLLNLPYQYTFIDPLQFKPDKNFFTNWCSHLADIEKDYDLIAGFSLGGAILQYALPSISKNKKIILFSTPSFTNRALYEKLHKIVQCIMASDMLTAMNLHHSYVFYPEKYTYREKLKNTALIKSRIGEGLTLLFEYDARSIISETQHHYLHLYGEKSALINAQNVMAGCKSQSIVIPNAGMRVLQNNQAACYQAISSYLGIKK